MKTVPARDAKNHFGEFINTARRERVTISRNGRPVAVMIPIEDYERLEALEDAHWGEAARKAEAEGYLGTDESDQALTGILDAQG